ncbi:MAG TPA: DUF1622 domain-containing protein [Deltaproteobacteria bacterium]|jgi:uncharacterized membrane protein|nr:DUF1622 domain-containing protein [Deltaproteobacteria bacterium]HOI08695.1 DUF1622 domain-containing protein [Deltaproteobacteria bacterium]
MDQFQAFMGLVGAAIDGAGVLVVTVGIVLATYRFLFRVTQDPYRVYRQDIGRAILLGLEFLVAGDIIRTVVVSPTLRNVTVLALIVLIRTFLSFALELELNGRLPWRQSG